MTGMSLLTAAADTTSGATALQTVMISAGVTLTVGILSVLGAYLLERFKRSVADRRWLLDRRHEAYVGALQSTSNIRRYQIELAHKRSTESANGLLEATLELEKHFFSITLVGSDAARTLGGFLMDVVNEMTPGAGSNQAMVRASSLFAKGVALELSPARGWWFRRQLSRRLEELIAEREAEQESRACATDNATADAGSAVDVVRLRRAGTKPPPDPSGSSA